MKVTNTQQCVLIDIPRLPLCPSHCTIQSPTSIIDIDVGRSFCKPLLLAKWENFTISDNITQKVVLVPEVNRIKFLQARKLRSMIKRPFFVYLYLKHHGMLEKLHKRCSLAGHDPEEISFPEEGKSPYMVN